MHLNPLFPLLTLLSTLSLAHARPLVQGTIYVRNNCSAPVYLWRTDVSTTSASYLAATNGTWNQPISKKPTTGVAIKIGSSEDSLWVNDPIFHYAYSINDQENAVYYSISSHNGVDPLFEGKKTLLTGTEGKGVPVIEWWGGPESGTKAYKGDTDFFLTLCAD